MRFKTVPEPPSSLADLATVRDALPRVPRSETDCCSRLARRVEWIDDRESGREWLLVLRALGLASRTADGGYVRARDGPALPGDDAALDRDARAALAAGFREHVLGADEVLGALDDEPRDLDAAFAAVEPTVPEWERRRTDDWRGTWRERTRRVLGWAVLLGAARSTADGYVSRSRADE